MSPRLFDIPVFPLANTYERMGPTQPYKAR